MQKWPCEIKIGSCGRVSRIEDDVVEEDCYSGEKVGKKKPEGWLDECLGSGSGEQEG